MKTEEIKKLVVEGKLMEALMIAGKFKRCFGLTEEELNTIRLGYSCVGNENFYKQIGINPQEKIMEALNILERVYGGRQKSEREKEIETQFNTFTKYFNRGSISMDDLYKILNIKPAADKNILLLYIQNLKERKLVEEVTFGIYINEGVGEYE